MLAAQAVSQSASDPMSGLRVGERDAPTAREVDNLRRERVRGDIVDTGANTAVDALRAAAAACSAAPLWMHSTCNSGSWNKTIQ